MLRALSVTALLLSYQGAVAKSDCASKDDAEEASMLQTRLVNEHDATKGYHDYHDYRGHGGDDDGDRRLCDPLSCDAVKEMCVVSEKCCKKARFCYGGKFCSNKVTGKPRAWPTKCVGKQPNMLGSWTFNGFRMNLYMNYKNLTNLTDWLDNVGGTSKSTSGSADAITLAGPPVGGSVDYVAYQDSDGYFQLVIYSPAGQTRRFCAFEPWNNKKAHCPGVARTDTAVDAQPDTNVVEIIEVQEVDCDCNALSFGIITYKQLLKEPLPSKANVGNSFIDTVVATKVCDAYPKDPAEAANFWPQGQAAPTVCGR